MSDKKSVVDIAPTSPAADGVHVVTVSGEIDLSNVFELQTAIDAAIAERPAALVVSLAEVDYFDSTTIKALLSAAEAACKSSVRLVVVRPSSESGRRVCDLVGLAGLVETYDSVEDAVSSLALGREV